MQKVQHLVVIGGGVMGLSTAYYASHFTQKITILEKATIGVENKKAASFSYTRSIRNDYLDPQYARLAYQARQLWLELQQHAAEPFLIDCGCLNIAKSNVTPDLSQTYAVQSFQTLTDLKLKAEALSYDELQQRFPQFDVDLGRLDAEAGMLYVPEVTRTLLSLLRERKVTIEEQVEVSHIQQRDGHVVITTNIGELLAEKVVIVAGLGTNDLLKQVQGCTVQFPLIPDRPSQCKYFMPPAARRAEFTTEDGKKISLAADGVAIQEGGSPVFQLKENVTLTSNHPEYSWVNAIQVWAPGAVDMSKGEIHVTGYAA